jgi:hypothetical protein
LYSITISSRSFTLAPATPLLLASLNPRRKLLLLANTGVNPAAFKFQSAPASATDGVTLDPASAAGGQGGSFLRSDSGKTINGECPVDSIWAYSQAGTTVSIEEGTEYAFL